MWIASASFTILFNLDADEHSRIGDECHSHLCRWTNPYASVSTVSLYHLVTLRHPFPLHIT